MASRKKRPRKPPPRQATRTALAPLLPALLVVCLPVVCVPWLLDPFALPKQLGLAVAAASALVAFAWRPPAFPQLPGLRLAIGAVVLAEATAFVASVDHRGAVLGVYGYRFGLVSHLSALIVFLWAATAVRNVDTLVLLLRAALLPLMVVIAYALFQAAGADPFGWANEWGRSFSTMGNPNDLAGLLVLSVAFLAGIRPTANRGYALRLGGGFAAIAAALMTTESRSGLLGLGVALVALPAFARAARWEVAGRLALVSAGAVAVVSLFALGSGEAATLTSRFGRTFESNTVRAEGLGTRADVWRGTLAVLADHPTFGVGQDGLMVTFNQSQPAGLGFPFNEPTGTGTDTLVSSPHSAPLEVLVTLGPLGAIAAGLLFVVVAASYWRRLRRGDSPGLSFLGAGVAGYLVVAALNPLSLATVGLLSLLGGAAVGMDPRTQPATLALPKPARRALSLTAGAVLLAVLGWSAAILAADRQSYDAAAAAVRADDAGALRQARLAARLVPIESTYRRQEVQSLIQLGLTRDDRQRLEEGERQQVRFLRDFRGLALDYLTLARVRAILGLPGVETALRAAEAASPNGLDTRLGVAAVRAAGSGP